jgi:hypothetical protein
VPLWSLEQLEACAKLTGKYLEKVRTNYKRIGRVARLVLGSSADDVVNYVEESARGTNGDTLQSVMATQHATKSEQKEFVHRLVEWSTPKHDDGNWMYRVTADNRIHYRLLTEYVSKIVAEKAAMLSVQTSKMLISEWHKEHDLWSPKGPKHKQSPCELQTEKRASSNEGRSVSRVRSTTHRDSQSEEMTEEDTQPPSGLTRGDVVFIEEHG